MQLTTRILMARSENELFKKYFQLVLFLASILQFPNDLKEYKDIENETQLSRGSNM